MTFLLKGEGHPGITLTEEEAKFQLKNNGISESRTFSIREYDESVKLPNGAIICWGNNAGS